MPIPRARNTRRAAPETAILEGRPAAGAPLLAPVRIFVGTEPGQYRAERTFLWSIERLRDPARRYEIHWMRDLADFRTSFWNTGFTNYRFAVPHFAGERGRAIYNDVDQVYLADPAELFDGDMDGHAALAIDERDTSVMLIDCGRMAGVWTLAEAQRRRKHGLLEAARAIPGGIGPLDAGWNARDAEARVGESKLVHFTTLHRQPWQPFPERFYYQHNPAGELWTALEREADLAGYRTPATSATPAGDRGREAPARRVPESSALEGEIHDLRTRTGSTSVAHLDPTCPGPETRSDGVVCEIRLDTLPDARIPAAIDRLFEQADRFVFAAVRCGPRPSRRLSRPPVGGHRQPPWWEWLFRTAAARHPRIHWRVAWERSRRGEAPRFDGDRMRLLQGGAFVGSARGEVPRVWMLADHKPGHATQSQGLADALGWPCERIDLQLNPLQELPNAWTRGTLATLRPESRARLMAPWPDLVIATGRRTAPVAAWIRAQSRGRTRTVQMGRCGAFHRDRFDLAVAPRAAGLYPDARRIETAAPVTRVSSRVLSQAAERWRTSLTTAPGPRLALLVGGSDAEHELDAAQVQKLGREVAELARREGGTVWVTTSRRTRPEHVRSLRRALGDTAALVHEWSPQTPADENPYLGLLALADALVVTGESASMLAEACATGKPVYVVPVRERSRSPRSWLLHGERWLADRVRKRAFALRLNRRRFERPQRGLEHLAAALLARGFVRSRRHTEALQRELIDRGLARIFDGKLAPPPAEPLRDVEQVANAVRALLGVPPMPPAQCAASLPTGSSPPPYP